MDADAGTLLKATGGAVVGGGAIVGAARIFDVPWVAVLVIAVGIAVLVLLLVAYLIVVKVRGKQRAAAADRSLMDVMRVRPRAVSDPVLTAKLDQLGERFKDGVEKYHRATGRRVSEDAWYLLVGESGSGKTEAIRRCGVEFPSGLQDEQQGAGGTTNMDWWFTEEAIILDTAGRYALDAEGDAGRIPAKGKSGKKPADEDDGAEPDRQEQARVQTDAEWAEFLKLVRKTRPNCPINGMLLVVPATSLIKDDPEDIQRKAKNLAKFLDQIRRTLEVRFPVFVLITKSDLIPGFREFFEHVTDPDLQQQMLGWTKPGSLDEPFNPDEVDDYLMSIRDKLVRRRLTLIKDPIHTEVAGARRLDEVDTLFTFPDRFAELAPKLRRYLQTVFVRSKFNQTPLFLRGIYFTSSMEQGAALDETLARIRGITMKQLEDEQRGWLRNRPVFLRELFMRKVFVENGLVTRESNVNQAKRKRYIATMGAGIAATLALIGATFYSYRKLNDAVGDERRLVHAVAETADKPLQWNLFAYDADKKVSQYRGGQKPLGGKDEFASLPLSWFYTDRVADVRQHDLPVPLMFSFLPRSQDVNVARRQATEAMFNARVLPPLIAATRARLANGPAVGEKSWDWRSTNASTQALRAILAIDSMKRGNVPPTLASKMAEVDVLKDLSDFALTAAIPEDDREALQKQGKVLQVDRAAVAYAAGLPDAATAGGSARANVEAAGKGIGRFSDYWKAQLEPKTSSAFLKAQELASQLEEFDATVASLEASSGTGKLETVADYQKRRSDYAAGVQKLSELQLAITQRVATLMSDPMIADAGTSAGPAAARGTSISGLVGHMVERIKQQADTAHQELLAVATDANKTKLEESQKMFASDAATGREVRALIERLAKDECWCANDQAGQPAYVAAVKLLGDAQGKLIELPATGAAAAGTVAFADVEASIAAATGEVKDVVAGWPSTDKLPSPIGRAAAIATKMLTETARPASRYAAAAAAIHQLPDNVESIGTSVKDHAVGAARRRNLTPFPLQDDKRVDAVMPLLSRYQPDAARVTLAPFAMISNELDLKADAPILERTKLSQDLTARLEAVRAYGVEYVKFWGTDVSEYFQPQTFDCWQDFQKGVAGKLNLNGYAQAHEDLRSTSLKALEAWEKIGFSQFDTLEADRQVKQDELAARQGDFSAKARADADQTISFWQGLTESPSAATQGILKLSGSEFAKGGFNAIDSQPYLHRLFLNGLDTLARQNGGVVKTKLDDFNRQFGGRFPIASRKAPPLSKDDVSRATAALSDLVAMRATPGTVEGNQSIGNGGTTAFRDVNERLAALRGNAEVPEQLIKSLNVLRALTVADGQANLHYKLSVIGPPLNADGQPLSKSLQYVDVLRGGKLVGSKTFLRTDAQIGEMPWSNDPPSAAFEFRFYKDDAAQQPACKWTIADDRLLVAQLLSLPGTHVDAKGTKWDFPIVVPQQKNSVQWFRITFEPEDVVLPPTLVDAWPK